jgi:hypothetical protein
MKINLIAFLYFASQLNIITCKISPVSKIPKSDNKNINLNHQNQYNNFASDGRFSKQDRE